MTDKSKPASSVVNRVDDAALTVLKKHAAGIQVANREMMTLQPVSGGQAALQELKSAINLIKGQMSDFDLSFSVNVDNTEGKIIVVSANNYKGVIELATALADADINFPGSAVHRSNTR
jgi:hypothetical protein